MRSGRSMKAGVMSATVGVALLLASAAAMAQAPERDRRGGEYDRRGGPEGQQQGPRRGERGGRQRGGWGGPQHGPDSQAQGRRPGGWGLGLLAAPDVDVKVTRKTHGVMLLVTSDKPDLAEQIRARLPEAIERMRERHAARTGDPKAGKDESGGPRTRRGGFGGPRTGGDEFGGPEARGAGATRRWGQGGQRFNAFVDERVDVKFVQKHKGVAIILTSDARKVAAQIKETVPRRIEMLKRFRERGQGGRPGADGKPRMDSMGGWLRLLTSKDVKIKSKELRHGVVLTYTSEDKEVAELLKKLSAQQLEHIEKLRQHRGESPWGGRQQGRGRGRGWEQGRRGWEDGGEQGRRGWEDGGERGRRGWEDGWERDDEDDEDDD